MKCATGPAKYYLVHLVRQRTWRRTMSSVNWTFTVNNPRREPVFCEEMKYLIFGREVGQSGTPHLQGYVQLKSRKRLQSVKKLIGEGHFEISRGSAASNVRYCKKDGDYCEFGQLQRSSRETGGCHQEESCREILRMHKEKIPTDEIEDEYPSQYRAIQALAHRRYNHRTEAPKVLYLHGKSGVGKSYNTQRACEDASLSYYFRPPGEKWWPGYEQQNVVILEEFASCFTCTVFLVMCDRSPFIVEIKCGHVPFNSDFIIVISNEAPEEQYSGVKEKAPARHDAYLRRVSRAYNCTGRTHDQIYGVVSDFLKK